MWGCVRLLGLVLLLSCVAHADIGLMLGESTGKGMSRWTSAGHSAVYLSRVCPETPVRLRLCTPGEQGAVLSNYINFNEDQPYEWNAVPLSVFLYGVDDPSNRPLYASPELRAALQDHFRQKWLGPLCPAGPCSDPKAHWRDVVAANFVRDIYMFEASTTLEQDEAFIRKFNALPNVDHYNGFTRNCADFARLVVNTYFPGAARADHINDFWMTSPKAISKSFTHYAVKHQLDFRVVRFTQIPGNYRHSSDPRKGTELVFTTKKWFFPMLLRSHELAMFTASYLLTGRFNPERELQRRPTETVSAQMIESKFARKVENHDLSKQLQQEIALARSSQFGTAEIWVKYADALAEYRAEARDRGLITAADTASTFATRMDAAASPVIDASGAIWLQYGDGASARRIGVSASNINHPRSDGEFAYSLLMARTSAEIANSPKNREMLPEFENDWALLEQARRNLDWKILARALNFSAPSPDSPQLPPTALPSASGGLLP